MEDLQFAVLVSANAEWRVVKPLFAGETIKTSPYGEYFFADIDQERALFFQGGWGKVAAAGSAQYVIDHFHPARLINVGTCGGVEGRRFAGSRCSIPAGGGRLGIGRDRVGRTGIRRRC